MRWRLCEETVNGQELEVLQLRFGGRRRTQSRQQVAQLLGASIESVWRIEQRALRKLRLSAIGGVTGKQNRCI